MRGTTSPLCLVWLRPACLAEKRTSSSRRPAHLPTPASVTLQQQQQQVVDGEPASEGRAMSGPLPPDAQPCQAFTERAPLRFGRITAARNLIQTSRATEMPSPAVQLPHGFLTGFLGFHLRPKTGRAARGGPLLHRGDPPSSWSCGSGHPCTGECRTDSPRRDPPLPACSLAGLTELGTFPPSAVVGVARVGTLIYRLSRVPRRLVGSFG